MDLDQLFRCFFGYCLDLNATFGRDHDQVLTYGTVEKDGAIILVLDTAAFFDQNAADDLAFFAGLDRHEFVADESVCDLICTVSQVP